MTKAKTSEARPPRGYKIVREDDGQGGGLFFVEKPVGSYNRDMICKHSRAAAVRQAWAHRRREQAAEQREARRGGKARRAPRTIHGVNVGALVASIKADLRQGVRDGWLPRTVRTFSDVHAHCDANMLGDQSAAFDAACAGARGDADKEEERYCAVINAAQGAVDRWLRRGALAKVGGPRKPRRGGKGRYSPPDAVTHLARINPALDAHVPTVTCAALPGKGARWGDRRTGSLAKVTCPDCRRIAGAAGKGRRGGAGRAFDVAGASRRLTARTERRGCSHPLNADGTCDACERRGGDVADAVRKLTR